MTKIGIASIHFSSGYIWLQFLMPSPDSREVCPVLSYPPNSGHSITRFHAQANHYQMENATTDSRHEGSMAFGEAN